jgi:hypothetical protein
VILAQHAHHLHRQVLDVTDGSLDVRALHGARRGYLHVAEVRFLSRASRRVGNVQARAWGHEGPLKRILKGCSPDYEFGRIVAGNPR